MSPAPIFLLLILLLLSAIFSASELAFMSISRYKLDTALKQNRFWAKALKYIKDRNDRLLITILILNNRVNFFAASYSTTVAIKAAKDSWLEQWFIVWITTLIVTFTIIIFWEIIPKSYATKNNESLSLILAKPFKFLMLSLIPLVYIIELITKIATWSPASSIITWDEIESLIDMSKDSWGIEAREHEKIKNMLEFSDITRESILTPRVKMDVLHIDTTVKERFDYALSITHSRIPLYGETIDDIDYIVNLRFLSGEMQEQNWDKKLSELKNLEKVMKIPINHPIDKLLDIFQNSHKHFAIVLDEYWWVAGIVTLEDIIEEVFWEIRDEYDDEEDKVRKVGISRYEVDPSIMFEDFLEDIDLDFENLKLEEKEYYATTLNYFITEELERFPKPWEVLSKNLYAENSEEDDDDVIWHLVFHIKDVVDSNIENVVVEVQKI